MLFKVLVEKKSIINLFSYKMFLDANLVNALQLMLIGMSTVFVVLLIVIGCGNLLITVVNKYLPEEEKPAAKQAQNTGAVSSDVAQAINLAISKLTNGKGKAEKIERM